MIVHAVVMVVEIIVRDNMASFICNICNKETPVKYVFYADGCIVAKDLFTNDDYPLCKNGCAMDGTVNMKISYKAQEGSLIVKEA